MLFVLRKERIMYKTFKVILFGILGLLVLSACQNTTQPTPKVATEVENFEELEFALGENPQLDFIDSKEGQVETQEVKDGAHKFANLWAHNATSQTFYTPSLSYQYNRRIDYIPGLSTNTYPLQNNVVRKLGTGYYLAVLKNFNGYGGIAHVTAYGTKNYCKPYFWFPVSTNTYVYVVCYTSSGARADSKFNLLFYKNSNTLTKHGLAYVLSHKTTSHTPSYFYQYNSRGSFNSVAKLGVGYYEVTFRRMNRDASEQNKGGTVLVSAYGYNSNRCKVRNWYSSGTSIKARVLCRNSNGVNVDTLFTATFMREPGTLGIPQNNKYELKSHYVWNSNANSALNVWFTPSLFYQAYHTALPAPAPASRIRRTGTGQYQVYIPGLKASNKTNVQVTAYGSSISHCNVRNWTGGTTRTYVNVYCFKQNGKFINSSFTLHYETNDRYN